MLSIPLNQSAKQAFTTTLGGRSFRFRIRWNTVMAAWYMDVSKVDGTPLTKGVRLVVNWPIRIGDPSDGGFDADAFLMVLDQNGTNAEAVRDSWGSTHHLIHTTVAESQVILAL